MATTLTFLIIISAIAVFVIMKKFSHTSKTYLVNFAIALLMGLLFSRTLMNDQLDWIGYLAIVFCGLAFIAQIVLGIKNLKTSD
ncbi:hypothetical protein [Paenisporosarcina sp.]|jgi:hypothetical protein|uniref:hypothetical protein n=1 Tax=Paenisporosarcina sp. TaxID=1932001 RepID=UPI003C724BD7